MNGYLISNNDVVAFQHVFSDGLFLDRQLCGRLLSPLPCLSSSALLVVFPNPSFTVNQDLGLEAECWSDTPLALGVLFSRFQPVLSRLWEDYAQRLLRYIGVTCVNVLVGQTLLYVLHTVADWPGIAANALAVTISSIPAYLLSRHYVWEQPRGGHSVGAEIAPFWILAFAGLALSTLTVGVVDNIFGGTLSVQLANASAFGALWIVRFLVLDRLLWGRTTNGSEAGFEDESRAR